MGHEMRWGGLAGLGAFVFAIIGGLVLAPGPGIRDSSDTIAAYVGDHRGQIMAGMLLYAIAIVLVVWFGAALSTAFRRADETSDLPAVVLAGFVLAAAIGFFVVSVFAGMTYAIATHPDLRAFAAGPYTALTVAATIAGIAAALPLAAAAVAIAHTHVFPMWMAWFAGVVAAARVLAAFTVGSAAGVLAPGSVLVTVVPGVLAGLWLLAASALLIREQLPFVPARAPHAMGHA